MPNLTQFVAVYIKLISKCQIYFLPFSNCSASILYNTTCTKNYDAKFSWNRKKQIDFFISQCVYYKHCYGDSLNIFNLLYFS